MRTVVSVIGAVIAAFGMLFALQGFGVLGGSAMSNSHMWAIIGVVVLVVGLIVITLGRRLGRRPRR